MPKAATLKPWVVCFSIASLSPKWTRTLFADSLVIIDFVEVPDEHQGFRFSHAFVRGIARTFRRDIIALIPALMSGEDADEFVMDLLALEGLRRHWERAGIVQIPGSDVMVLFSSR